MRKAPVLSRIWLLADDNSRDVSAAKSLLKGVPRSPARVPSTPKKDQRAASSRRYQGPVTRLVRGPVAHEDEHTLGQTAEYNAQGQSPAKPFRILVQRLEQRQGKRKESIGNHVRVRIHDASATLKKLLNTAVSGAHHIQVMLLDCRNHASDPFPANLCRCDVRNEYRENFPKQHAGEHEGNAAEHQESRCGRALVAN